MTALTFPFKVDLSRVHLTDEQFYQLCIDNPDNETQNKPSSHSTDSQPISEPATAGFVWIDAN